MGEFQETGIPFSNDRNKKENLFNLKLFLVRGSRKCSNRAVRI